jgi:hypothetical protein
MKSTDNGLPFCPTKSQAIFVSNPPSTVPLPIFFLGGLTLESKDVVTDLGLLIDWRFWFGQHVTNICMVYASLRAICVVFFVTFLQ